MPPGARCSRSKAEVVFRVMNVLLAGRIVCGAAALSLTSVKRLIGAPPRQVASALTYLSNEGIVCVDRRQDIIRLTDRALRELTG